MDGREGPSFHQKNSAAPVLPIKEPELDTVDAFEPQAQHLVLDLDRAEESIASIRTLLATIEADRAQDGAAEKSKQEISGLKLIRLIEEYGRTKDAPGVKAENTRNKLIGRIEAAAEAFSTQGNVAGGADERFNNEEMSEPKGPGSAPGKNGAPKQRLEDLAKLKDALTNSEGKGDQGDATPPAPPSPPQAPAHKERGASLASKRHAEEPITAIDVTNPEAVEKTIAQLETEVQNRKRWRIEKSKEAGKDIPRTGAERSAANLIDQLKRYQAGSVDDLAQMQSISRDFRRAVDAYGHFQTSFEQKEAAKRGGAPFPNIKTQEDSRFVTPLHEERAKNDGPDTAPTPTQKLDSKIAKAPDTPVTDKANPPAGDADRKTTEPKTDAPTDTVAPPSPRKNNEADKLAADAPVETGKKKAPAKKSAVSDGVNKGRNKIGDENTITTVKGGGNEIRNKEVRKKKGNTTGGHKLKKVRVGRDLTINNGPSKEELRDAFVEALKTHTPSGGAYATPPAPSTPTTERGAPNRHREMVAEDFGQPKEKSIRGVRGPVTVDDIPERMKGAGVPVAPGNPAARVGAALAAAPSAPGVAAPSVAAAPASGGSPEDHIRAYKEWMMAGSPSSPGAAPVVLTPAAEKKFEGILNNPADLTEIRALADTVAAAHVKEAAFNTPAQRMLGWVPFAFGKRKAEKKVAMQESAAAYDAWIARLQTHREKVWGEAEAAVANKRGWNSERKTAVLRRYRGLMGRKLVQKQMAELDGKKVALMPPVEKGLVRKSLDVYGKLPGGFRVGASSLLVTGAVALTGGFGGVAAGAIYFGSRFSRGMVGVAVGTAVTKAVSSAARHFLRSRAGLQKGEDHRANAYRRISTEARKGGMVGKPISDVRDLFQLYNDAVKKNDREKLIAFASGAVVGMAAGAGTANLLQGVDSWLEPAKRGASAVVEPGLVNEDARAVGQTPVTPSHVLTEESGSRTPQSPSPEGRGPVDERDLENPAQRNGTSKGPAAPAEKSAPGKGAAPTPTPKAPSYPAPGGGGTIDDVGVEERPAPGKGAAPEFRKIPPQSGQPVPERLQPAPSGPETSSKPSAPPAEPSKPSAPSVPSRIFETPIQAQSGDTVWGITEKHLSGDARFVALDRAQQDFVLDSYKNQLRSLGPEWLKKNGLSSGDIDKLQIGEAPNLSILNSPDLHDSIFEKADALTREQRINILKYRGMSAADATKLLDARPISAPIPTTPPGAPTPTQPVEPPAPKTPTTPSYTPMSPREEAALVEMNQEPASIDVNADNELEVERERAGMELAEKMRADERQALIDQGTKLTEGEEAREEAAEAARNAQRPLSPEALDPEHMGELSPRTRPGVPVSNPSVNYAGIPDLGEDIPPTVGNMPPPVRGAGIPDLGSDPLPYDVHNTPPNPQARYDTSIHEGPGYDPRMEGAGSLKTPEPVLGQESAPKDYSAYTGEKPPFNAEAYGGVSEAQFNSLVRTHTMDTITEYFGTRGIFVQNSGFGRFDSAIAWREARGFIEAVKSDPESMAESAGVNTKKLSAFVEYLERNAANYNLSTKTSVSSLLEEITKRGVENSVSRTNLP